MTCRDFMLRVCSRTSCKMLHEVKNCTNASCNKSNTCKKVHLTDDEVTEINKNIRPFRQNVYLEMTRLAYMLRETFPKECRSQVCTLNMLGECLWPCLACGTCRRNTTITACNNCYISLTKDNMKALRCCHIYCDYCFDRLPFTVKGPLPLWCCEVCSKWAIIFILY
ncbi:uncharacterized protein LOC112468928 [Temnothorax curvispinosus]|uniref:Uncharacterized protein LOC112468928 n=1 Tax=Temnothorax curvispinosus TaxID=300111 RepID=A0A6J1RGJ4_9HYME|nr:uncharacterized protein LOC112468928 [Temnothorax curvispinosus]